MSRNEAQTRFELIDPMLVDQRGWRREDLRLEVTTKPQIDIVYGKGQRRPGSGRADYLLCRPLTEGAEPTPLAILEAKREGLPAEHGLQQGKGYRVGHLHHVPFVFASNGKQFVEHDQTTGITADARPLEEFPRPEELLARYLADRDLPAAAPDLAMLTTPYAQGRAHLRYYQDAAIRAAMEKIIQQRAGSEAPRVLLSLATGAGKTRLAAALIRKLYDAGKLGKALFVCDRTELRDNGLNDFQAAFGNDTAEMDKGNPQKNARVLIATYQMLDPKASGDVSFFRKHYPANFFDVIVIDECHRSAWGDWHVVLEQNSAAIQNRTHRHTPEKSAGRRTSTMTRPKREWKKIADGSATTTATSAILSTPTPIFRASRTGSLRPSYLKRSISSTMASPIRNASVASAAKI